MLLLFVTALFSGDLENSAAKAVEEGVYEERYWSLLLHFDGEKSEIEDPSFFISPNGRFSRKDELLATLEALYNETRFDDNSTACGFPARKRWLKERLGLKGLPKVECRKYEEILKRVDPVSATLVFPSAHINSPASMFGHTFLRINSSYNSRLLSYAINYAADADPSKENGVIFAIKGLFGGYYGRYSLLPYYDKLKEYRDTENRDIWEYDLNLDRNETLRMFEHMWEVKDARSSYYFFTDNCSYEMLWLLEAARPEARLREKFMFEVIPLETVHAARESGLITHTGYRPSKRSKIEAYKSVLDAEDIEMSKELAKLESTCEEKSFEVLLPDKKRHILEASIELTQYYYRKGELEKDRYLEIFHYLTSNRAKLGRNVKKAEPIRPPDPLKSHRAKKVLLGAGSLDSQSTLFFGLRMAYHNLTDPLYGFLRGTQIEFLNIEGYTQKRRTRLEKATILSIESITQSDDFFTEISWRTNIGWNREYLDSKSRFNFSVGAGYGVGNRYGYLYAVVDPQLYAANSKAVAAVDIALGLVVDRYSGSTNTKLEYRHKLYEGGLSQNMAILSQNFRLKQNISLDLRYRYIERRDVDRSYDEHTFAILGAFYF